MEGISKGYLYFIREADSSRVKIGFTQGSVKKRLSTLQVGCPTPLVLEHYFEVLEKVVHDDLKLYSLRGEWFTLGSEDLEAYLEAFKECRLPDYQ